MCVWYWFKLKKEKTITMADSKEWPIKLLTKQEVQKGLANMFAQFVERKESYNAWYYVVGAGKWCWFNTEDELKNEMMNLTRQGVKMKVAKDWTERFAEVVSGIATFGCSKSTAEQFLKAKYSVRYINFQHPDVDQNPALERLAFGFHHHICGYGYLEIRTREDMEDIGFKFKVVDN